MPPYRKGRAMKVHSLHTQMPYHPQGSTVRNTATRIAWNVVRRWATQHARPQTRIGGGPSLRATPDRVLRTSSAQEAAAQADV